MVKKAKLTFLFMLMAGFLLAQQPGSMLEDIKHCSNQKKLMYLKQHDTIGLNYDLKYHRIHWHLNPNQNYIRGSVFSVFKAKQVTDSISFQLAGGMQVDSILYHQNKIAPAHKNNVITAHLPHQIDQGVMDSLTIYYQGEPSDTTGAFEQSVHGAEEVPVIWTLSEPYGAKQWWPSKNALNDKIDSLDIFVHVAPTHYEAASNGILVKDTVITSEDERIFHWEHRYPIATYLIAVAVTDYRKHSEYINFQEDSLKLVNYIYDEDYTFAVNHIPNFYKSFKLFDTLFMPYPFFEEQYGHAQMNRGGGMEHQTMTFIGSYDFHLLTHEVAHQWFGNYITLDNWHDIWLNEGFATYLTGLAYEKAFDTDKWWNRWRPQVISHITSKPGGSVYVNDITDPARIFDGRLSYSKGAYLLHMIRWVIGDKAFFQAIRNYLADPAVKYGYAGNEDLIHHFEQLGDTTLTEFFDDWYYGEGYPSYDVSVGWINGESVKVILSQQQSHPSVDFFEMPLPIRFRNSKHDTIVVYDHKTNHQEFITNLGFFPDSVGIDPNYHLISAENSITVNTETIPEKIALRIGPNPVQEILQVYSDEKIQKIEVYTIDGKLVKKSGIQGKQNTLIHVARLKQGIYLLRVSMSSGIMRWAKFIKKR